MVSVVKTGVPSPRFELGIEDQVFCPSALAPMQDVTGLPFMRVIARRGEPDLFFTEFFRVHVNSRLSPEILSSIIENPTAKPVYAQIIGENISDIKRTILDLKKYPIAGVDLNMGCPAPRVYKKNVGGGLLRDPEKVNSILSEMRSNIEGNLTVKMRIGFDDDRNFDEILKAIKINQVNLLSIHVRTVTGGYNSAPDYTYVSKAVQYLDGHCPVLVNGSIETAEQANNLKVKLGTRGVMIGRAAIRNPWIFRQIREIASGLPPFIPTRKNVHEYCVELYNELSTPRMDDKRLVSRIKKFLNYVGQSIDKDGVFLREMRRSSTKNELFSVFDRHLSNDSNGYLEILPEPLICFGKGSSADCASGNIGCK
ncbi:tRNA-dihydrouridine synthase family protein [Opitutales bacterium]|nr:tRNA-dihydrouridine synthase family protein [Opitutales bacterium]